jgi:hypothetical protein
MTTNLRRLPRRRHDVRLHDKELRSYLVAPDQQVAHELNPTARAVWELCDGTTTVDELADAICRVFQVPREQALADVQVVVQQLGDAGLVTWSAHLEEAQP